MAQEVDVLMRELGDVMEGAKRRVAVAESLTGGELSARLACVPGSGAWFRGGVVAYASDVKHDLLDVPEGRSVVSPEAATQMATAVRRLLRADLTVAVTGVAGPDEQEGKSPGTVWLAVDDDGQTDARLVQLEGSPGDVVNATCEIALRWLLECGSGAAPSA